MSNKGKLALGFACLFLVLTAVAVYLVTGNTDEVATSSTVTPDITNPRDATQLPFAPTTLSTSETQLQENSEPSNQTAAETTPSLPSSSTEVGTAPNSRTAEINIGGEIRRVALSNAGWIIPEEEGGIAIGADLDNLVPFVPANDGPSGVTITEDFLRQNAGAAWLSEENGVPVISNIDADNLCLNILTRVILRDSYVNCPTKTQNDTWDWVGQVDDAPAVQVLGDAAAGSIVEYNTVTCSGFDGEICARAVRAAAPDMVVRFNDLSGARGAVQMFHGTTFAYNYAHSFSFGFDPRRANNPDDRITHNNAVNDQGYNNTLVAGNYIDATYARVSQQPNEYLNPHFRNLYENGVVEVGDPLNGFAFAHYLNNGNGTGSVWTRNYVYNSGRPFRCNSSSNFNDSVCSEDISFNVFDNLRKSDFFDIDSFEDADGRGALAGRCNFQLSGDTLSSLLFPGEGQGNDCQSQLDLDAASLESFSTESGNIPFTLVN